MTEESAPPEARLIEERREAIRPKLSVRKAAAAAGISEGRWRQIVKGYNQLSADVRVPSQAPAATLARMAWVVKAGADELREVGRGDAADELELLDRLSREPAKVRREVREAIASGPRPKVTTYDLDLDDPYEQFVVDLYGLAMSLSMLDLRDEEADEVLDSFAAETVSDSEGCGTPSFTVGRSSMTMTLLAPGGHP